MAAFQIGSGHALRQFQEDGDVVLRALVRGTESDPAGRDLSRDPKGVVHLQNLDDIGSAFVGWSRSRFGFPFRGAGGCDDQGRGWDKPHEGSRV